MKEQDRLDAMEVGLAFSGVYFPPQFSPDLLNNERRFIKACKLFYKNSSDFKVVCSGLCHGIDHISLCHEEYVKFLASIGNPAIPTACHELLKAQREEWARCEINKKAGVKNKSKQSRATRLYLMKNVRNGLVKIGHSKNPLARESTLQSEDPEIELLGDWAATITDEESLHAEFADRRVRGEWFKLTAEDVSKITSRFKEVQ